MIVQVKEGFLTLQMIRKSVKYMFKKARLVAFVDATRTLLRKRKRRRRTLLILLDQLTGIASYMSTESILT
jgi:hypothetical protein